MEGPTIVYSSIKCVLVVHQTLHGKEYCSANTVMKVLLDIL